MATHAELSVRLLLEAAGFFRTLAAQNDPLRKDMTQNAVIFDQVAALLQKDPGGAISDKTHAQMAARLMRDAAAFFRRLGGEKEPIREQMDQNASVYEQMAALLEKDPDGALS